MSDRICIASGKKTSVILSPEDLVECDSGNMGCNGGWLNKAWDYMSTTGAVTDDCLPYTSGAGAVTQCPTTCANKSVAFTKYKCAAKSVIQATNQNQIQSAILAGGPMETGFTVYQDFFNYKSGVYHHVSGGVAGGHAVKMLGWGVTPEGEEYWICANSWGADWGLDGFFNIRVGDSGIDQAVYGCTPDLNTSQYF
jgi:cathepsin B